MLRKKKGAAAECKTNLAEQDRVTIPVIEEEMSVGKRRVETGGVRVKKRVTHHTETVEVPTLEEHVKVRHVKIGQPIDAPPPVREEGNVTIIPVIEEVVVITKQLMLREEIHLERETKSVTKKQKIRLASERVEVNRLTAEDDSTE